MLLEVERKYFTEHSTIGELHIVKDDIKYFQCFVLEDRIRKAGVKVKGETAIPTGKYEVVLAFSPKNQKDMPLLLEVPGFTGILIHIGNKDKDTEGCLLVGQVRGVDAVYQSTAAFAQLFSLIKVAYDAKDPIWITYTNVNPPQELLQ